MGTNSALGGGHEGHETLGRFIQCSTAVNLVSILVVVQFELAMLEQREAVPTSLERGETGGSPVSDSGPVGGRLV